VSVSFCFAFILGKNDSLKFNSTCAGKKQECINGYVICAGGGSNCVGGGIKSSLYNQT